MNRARARLGWWCAAVALGWVACASGPAPIDHYYSVEINAPGETAAPSLSGTLHVDRPRTDALIGQRHLLYRRGEGSAEISKHNYHHWSDPPAVAIQTSLVSFLRRANVAKTVMEANARTRPDYTVSGRLRRFERVLDAQAVVVDLDLTLTDSAGSPLVHQNYVEHRPASDIEQAAGAMGDAVQAIFERFLADVRNTAAGGG